MRKKVFDLRQQAQFATLLAELLSAGFSLNEALSFFVKIKKFPQLTVQHVQESCRKGSPLSQSFSQLGYSPQQIVQIQLAERHGNLLTTLSGIGEQLKMTHSYQKEVKRLLSYPCLLFLSLLLILFSMRQIVLPQLLLSGIITDTHWGIVVIRTLPLALVAGLIILGSSYFFSIYLLKKTDPIKKANLLKKIPLIGRVYSFYLSSYFAMEWGKLFSEGIELFQIIEYMRATDKKGIACCFAQEASVQFLKGKPFTEQLEQYPFLTKELILIIQQGEATGKLGQELVLYSQAVQTLFFEKIHRGLTILQPVLFVGVAGLILFVYAAMLLPIYGNMEGVIK